MTDPIDEPIVDTPDPEDDVIDTDVLPTAADPDDEAEEGHVEPEEAE